MERWTGRLAVVTGASSGIGEALAKGLAHQGMKVAALARRMHRLQKLAEDCRGYKGFIKGYKCDVGDENAIATTMKAICEDLGPISVLINNAAIMMPENLTDKSKGSPRKLYEINVVGPVTIAQHTVEIMKKHNITDGHIININSIFALDILHYCGYANYCASKNALGIVTDSLRSELAVMKSKTRVTTMMPGYVKTDMADKFFSELLLDVSKRDQLPVLKTEDIVECIIFILSLNPNINVSELRVQPTGENLLGFANVINK